MIVPKITAQTRAKIKAGMEFIALIDINLINVVSIINFQKVDTALNGEGTNQIGNKLK